MKPNAKRNPIDRPRYSPWCIQLVRTLFLVFVATFLMGTLAILMVKGANAEVCEYWVAPKPTGDNSNPGTKTEPWATIEYASSHLPDETCTVWVAEGTYVGEVHLVERYDHIVTFKAMVPYKTILENRGTVLNFDGARNIVIEGFSVRHTEPGGDVQVVKVDRSAEAWTENLTFRNNIFHDSYNDDLLKIYNGVRFVTVENNIFFNQASREEHIDINGVTDITVRDNIFFNDFAGSGRPNEEDTKSFITIKDSNGDEDDQLGSQRIHVRRNIFLNWEGGRETFIQIGNDGKPYYEAEDISIENNLLIGNSREPVYAAFGVRGVKNVTFANNTIVGDLPSSAYAMWVSLKDENRVNRNIAFVNNIWSDPTGTMGASQGTGNKYSNGSSDQTEGLLLNNNLYWNGERNVPSGDLVSPRREDTNGVFADPLLNEDQQGVVLPRWNGESFLSGSTSIRHEFIRLVEVYGKTSAGSPVIDVANPEYVPTDDILGQPRVGTPDIGAYEYYPLLTGGARLTEISIDWSNFGESQAVSFAIHASDGNNQRSVSNIPPDTSAYTLKNLVPYSLYTITVTALDDEGQIIGQSTPLVLMTTDEYFTLPYAMRADSDTYRATSTYQSTYQ